MKAGDPLYQIDPKPFEVELQASKAALDKAKAALDLAVPQALRLCDDPGADRPAHRRGACDRRCAGRAE